MKKIFISLGAALTLFCGVASADSIDFNSYTDGTALSSVGGVSFSLAGGPGPVGTPTIGLHSYSEGGLINSIYGGVDNGYPTTNILSFTFASLASNVSMSVWESAPVTWIAYDASNSIVSSGYASGSFAIGGTGIRTIDLNNNHGTNNWVFSVAKLDYSTVTAVPEPETYAMMLAGLGLLGSVARRRKAKQG